MNISIRSIICFLLIVSHHRVAICQRSSFKLSLAESPGKLIPENQYRDLQNVKTVLQLEFKRGIGDKSEHEVYVFEYSETKRSVRMLVPETNEKRKLSTISDTTASRVMDLVSVDSQRPDSIKLAVMVATGFNFIYYDLNDLTDTSWLKYSWLQPKRDSLFNSFMRMINSDINALPTRQELDAIATIKKDNLQEIETDLGMAINVQRAGICFKELIGVNARREGNKLLTAYKNISPPKSTVQMSWSKPRDLLFQPGTKSPLDEMIEDAARKHLKLLATRGVESRVSDQLKFSLKELVETLSQWTNKTGLLLYSFDSSGLQILYADNTKKVDTAHISISKQRLNLLAAQLQSYLNPGNSSQSNIRGLKGRAQSRPGTLDSIARIISQVLLPAKFDLGSLEHLVIIPSYNIATFPFAMLPIKDSLLLIDKMSYSIVPSINEFIITGQVRRAHFDNMDRSKFDIRDDSVYWSFDKNFLFVGSPVADKVGNYSFDPLPGTKLEIQELRKKVPSPVVLLDKDAEKSKVIKAIKDADVIYFATHGIADGIDPLNKSFLLLSGKGNEAMLTAKEIQQLDLKASLVILSACETGLGKSHEGGMIGLSRAFEIAGAKNVVMSLWPVSDNKTPILMKHFFEALENNGNGHLYFPHDALRQAILKFKREEKDPVYWAAFCLFGVPL